VAALDRANGEGMHSRLVVAAIAAAGLLVPATAHAAVWKTVASGSSKGQYAVASASRSVASPAGLRIRTNAGRSARVDWSLACSKGTKVVSRTGHHTARAGQVDRRLDLPMDGGRDRCFLGASAQLQGGGGTIRVALQKLG
jgi:hypothetical protein